jgi:hypothetical protein
VPYLVLRILSGNFFTGIPSFLILGIVILSIPRVIAVFRPRTEAQARYFECTPGQRWTMGLLYFSLLASLYMGMGFLRGYMQGGSF